MPREFVPKGEFKVFLGWRPVSPDEILTRETKLVCIWSNYAARDHNSPDNGYVITGGSRWIGRTMQYAHQEMGMNDDYWGYVPDDGKPYVKPSRYKPHPFHSAQLPLP
jgi:hypothetical protein